MAFEFGRKPFDFGKKPLTVAKSFKFADFGKFTRSYQANVVLPKIHFESSQSYVIGEGTKAPIAVKLECAKERRRSAVSSLQEGATEESTLVILEEVATRPATLHMTRRGNSGNPVSLILQLKPEAIEPGARHSWWINSMSFSGSVAHHRTSRKQHDGRCMLIFTADLEKDAKDCNKFYINLPKNPTPEICLKGSHCPSKSEEANKISLDRQQQVDVLTIRIDIEAFGAYEKIKHEVDEGVEGATSVPGPMQKQFFSGAITLFKEGSCTDITLSCQGQEYPFYRMVLASYSEVFKAMFEHSECSESKDRKIIVEGCSPEALKAFLEMLISGQPSNGSISDVALSTFVLADKYNIKSLKDFCVPYIIKDLSEKNCLETLVTSYLHDNDAVTDAALEVLRANKTSLMASEEWREIVADYPKLVSQLLFKTL